MSCKQLMAIDFGASGGKCFAGKFEDGKLTMQEVHRFAHEGVSFFAEDSKGEMSERTYWNDIHLYHNIIKGLQAYRRDVSDNLDSIGIDTWGADGQFVSPDGDMLNKVYCYRDHRLDDMIEKVKARIDADKVYELTGIHFQPFNVSNQMLWFMLNRKKELCEGSVYLPIPAVFNYYLCGSKCVDTAFASVTQLMNAHTKEWSPEILEALDIPAEVMPEIVEPGSVIGKLHSGIAEIADLNQPDMIAVGAHDTACAYAAAPVEDYDKAMIISSGTWSLVGKLVPEPFTTKEAMEFNLSNEGGIGNVRLLKNCMGTWIVQELIKAWKVQDGKDIEWAELDKPTVEAPAFVAFIDPDNNEFYNPKNMQVAIDEFCERTGQQKPQTRGSYLRTVYESLALKYRSIKEQLDKVTGKEIEVCNIVGGGTRNIMLNQYTANALGVTVKAGPEEGTAIGNLLVQALGLGIISDMQEAIPIIKNSFPIKEYTPQDSEEWNVAYDRFMKFCYI